MWDPVKGRYVGAGVEEESSSAPPPKMDTFLQSQANNGGLRAARTSGGIFSEDKMFKIILLYSLQVLDTSILSIRFHQQLVEPLRNRLHQFLLCRSRRNLV